jgi:hypothetical protein
LTNSLSRVSIHTELTAFSKADINVRGRFQAMHRPAQSWRFAERKDRDQEELAGATCNRDEVVERRNLLVRSKRYVRFAMEPEAVA